MYIADEIKRIKEEGGFTFRDLALKLEVTEQTVRNWAQGVYVPPADKMDLLRALGKGGKK